MLNIKHFSPIGHAIYITHCQMPHGKPVTKWKTNLFLNVRLHFFFQWAFFWDMLRLNMKSLYQLELIWPMTIIPNSATWFLTISSFYLCFLCVSQYFKCLHFALLFNWIFKKFFQFKVIKNLYTLWITGKRYISHCFTKTQSANWLSSSI